LLAPTPSRAVDIPFTQVFFGRQFRSVLDDVAHYPDAYVSLEASYWDIYYERRGNRLHDYDQRALSATALGRRGAVLLGLCAWSDDLSLQQENVYTDSDRMEGNKSNDGGKVMLGYTLARALPLAVTALEVVGSAGTNGEFLADLELRLSWSRTADLLFKWETFSNALDIDETANGSEFPFHFPFETDRWFARVQVNAPDAFRFRVWGLYETNSGAGDSVEDFENRVWFRRGGVGGSIDYRLEPAHRLYLAPRLSDVEARGPGARLRVEYTAADGDLGMHFNGVRYLHLDGLEFANPIARADIVPLRWLSVFGGWERLQLEHHGSSFFDVWPFSIWDIFLAKRYRLDEFETTLDTWFVGATGRFENKPFLAEFSGRFEWWDGATHLDWLERVDILFPFFFRYERHHESWEIEADYAVQADAALWWRFGSRSSIRVSGRATIPFETSEDTDSGGGPGGPPKPGPPAPPASDSSHGGLMGTVELVIGR